MGEWSSDTGEPVGESQQIQVGNYAGPSPTLLIIDCDGRDYFFDSQFDG